MKLDLGKFLLGLLRAGRSGDARVTIIDPQEKELNAAIARSLHRAAASPIPEHQAISDSRILIDGAQRYMQLYHHERIRADRAEQQLRAERTKKPAG